MWPWILGIRIVSCGLLEAILPQRRNGTSPQTLGFSFRASISFLGFRKTSHFILLPIFSRSSMAPFKIVAEYARSGRSSCKKCCEPISVNTLRLGSVIRDARLGIDVTKWHHLNCFPTKSQSAISVEKINGFSLLKADDQEALKNLEEESMARIADDKEESGTKERPSKTLKVSKGNGDKECMTKADDQEALKNSATKSKVCKADDLEESGAVEITSKKLKKGVVETEIVLSDSDVKCDYKGIELMQKWKSFQTVIFLEKDEGLTDSSKIAAFDFDGCLAKTNVRNHGADAWSLMFPTIPEKLKKLYKDGYKVVIFTNEANIERWKNKRQAAIDSKVGRLTNFIKRVEVPLQVFIACGHGGEDGYRKPKIGMWRLMEKYYNSGIKVDMAESFYVGDAAGRETDHSDADIKFAEAIGLKFHLPEDYFGA